MDGLEATRRIRAELTDERQPHIIAMTANAFAEDRVRCLDAGMDDYLSKPVRKDQLAAALAKAITKPQRSSRNSSPMALEADHV
jgi:CheY-like chemotaxis protein